MKKNLFREMEKKKRNENENELELIWKTPERVNTEREHV